MSDMPSAPPVGENFTLIDTAPAHHIYTGGLLCNLQNPGADQVADYVCGELTWDGAQQALNWYHWDGAGWTCTVVSNESGIAVGMDAADLTGNGRGDIVAADWPLGPQAKGSTGHIYWFEQPDNPYQDAWPRHLLAPGWGRAHDLHMGDITGQGQTDVLVRLKDGRIAWYARPNEPRHLWQETLIAEAHPGDGTALYDVTGTGSLDVVTGSGFFENTDGAGQAWRFRPFAAAQELGLDVETRVAVGDCLGDGSVTVVISESELLNNARLLVLHSADRGKTWTRHILIDRGRDLGALHSLQLLDVTGDGRPDIFTAEMELYIEDAGIVRRPMWKLFVNKGGLDFAERTVLDANLGAHMGFAGRLNSNRGIDFVAKNWKANTANACGGMNHIVHVTPGGDWK